MSAVASPAEHGRPPDHDHERCVDDALGKAAALCARRGARLTDLRRRVLELVWQGHEAVKAYDVLERLGSAPGAAKPPTVYRALDFLLEQGFIHRLASVNAFVGCHHPHERHSVPFLICDNCHAAIELEDERIPQLLDTQAKALGFSPRAQTLEVHGLCAKCSAA